MSACGDVESKAIDARVDQPPDSEVPDAREPSLDATPAPCDLSRPFGEPVQLPEVNSASSDSDAWLSNDRLTIYFNSSRAGGLGGEDIYFATRPTVDDAFGTPVLVPNVNSSSDDGVPLLSGDGLVLYFGSRRAVAGTWDLYIATRASTAAAFGTPSLMLVVNSDTGHEMATDLSADGRTLYFSSTRTGDWDMYRATRAIDDGPFGAPTPIGELNMAGIEDYGTVLPDDELTAFFESIRPDGAGCNDVYVATRSTVNDGFGAATRVAELSTASCEYPTWVSADGCHIALSSDRPGSAGFDLWIASRP